MGSHDLRRILNDWPFQPDQITVRTVVGDDGKVKIQMRLDLGLLQMEVEGRPDGQRPNGMESLMHYYRSRLDEHVRRNGTELGFQLSPDECRALREESVMYYHRYLSLFVLEDFDGVARDTARNLQVLDLCKRYAAEEEDRVALEQYRPYIVMMNARAQAHKALSRKATKTALAAIDNGLRTIREFYEEIGQEELFDESSEAAILQAMRSEVERLAPSDPIMQLEKQLSDAVREERYEDAAALRDKLASMRTRPRPRRRRKPNA